MPRSGGEVRCEACEKEAPDDDRTGWVWRLDGSWRCPSCVQRCRGCGAVYDFPHGPECPDELQGRLVRLSDCQPEQGGDGDWSELLVVREAPGEEMLCLSGHPQRLVGAERATDPRHVRRYVPAPTQPSISEGDRERLRQIADELGKQASADYRILTESWCEQSAAFLRRLASAPPEVSGEGKDRCPTCGSSNPWFTDCKDKAAAKAETGCDFPSQSSGCGDSWHESRIASPPEPSVEEVRSEMEKLIDWHERRAKVERINADQESDPTTCAILLGNADAHDVAAAVLSRVLEGKPVEDL